MNTTSRFLTYALAGLYAVLGAWLFLDSAGAATGFAWKVSPFQAMTIGGWCLGNGWLAFSSARRWRWPLVSGSLVYLWLFGVLESLVLLAFISKLVLATPLAWLYVVTLGLNVLLAVWGAAWLLGKGKPKAQPKARPVPKLPVWGFLVFASLLGLYGLLAPPDGPALNAGIFPEVLGAFTLRAFGAFYLSLGLAAVMLLIPPTDINRAAHYASSAMGIIVFISIAFIVYWSLFDFGAHPFQWLYPGAYIFIGVPLFFALLRLGTGETK